MFKNYRTSLQNIKTIWVSPIKKESRYWRFYPGCCFSGHCLSLTSLLASKSLLHSWVQTRTLEQWPLLLYLNVIIKSNAFQSAINSLPEFWLLSGEQPGPGHITLTLFLAGHSCLRFHQLPTAPEESNKALDTWLCGRHVLSTEVVIFPVLILLLLPNLLTFENYL